MKFEDKIKEVVEKLDENIPAPQTMGNPVANNPAQVAPQQQELTADDMLNWAMAQDPKTTEQFTKLEGEEKFQAIADAMANANANEQGQPNAQMNPVAASNNQQNTSASPASTNTSGTMGAGTTQV
jgi:hypothetical protein